MFQKRVRRKCRFLIALGRVLGGFWEGFGRVWRGFWEGLGVSWALLGASGVLLGVSCVSFWSLGRLLSDFKPSGKVLGVFFHIFWCSWCLVLLLLAGGGGGGCGGGGGAAAAAAV